MLLFAQTFNAPRLLDYHGENKNNNDPGKHALSTARAKLLSTCN